MQIKHLATKNSRRNIWSSELNYGKQNSDATEIPEGANFL